MTRAMGKRLSISVAEGKKRPHQPVQAAKFASEAGVIVRDHVPIFTHWKDYKKEENAPVFENFVGKLAVSDFLTVYMLLLSVKIFFAALHNYSNN